LREIVATPSVFLRRHLPLRLGGERQISPSYLLPWNQGGPGARVLYPLCLPSSTSPLKFKRRKANACFLKQNSSPSPFPLESGEAGRGKHGAMQANRLSLVKYQITAILES